MATSSDAVLMKLLIVRCQLGDDAAFTELVSGYQTRLYQYLHQFIRDINTVNDLYQDVWLDVFRSIGKLKDVEAFSAWLYRIAHDRVCLLFRRRGLQYGLDTSTEVIDSSTEAGDVHWDFDSLHLAMDQLLPSHREVLVLHYLHDFDYAEISTILACPLGTVRSRLFYARQALRALLESEQHHERKRSPTSVAE